MQLTQDNLIRKQIMLSNSNISKLEKIAEERGASVAEIVRLAVDNYNPNIEDMGDQELMALVSKKLREAIKETDRVSRRINKTVKQFLFTKTIFL